MSVFQKQPRKSIKEPLKASYGNDNENQPCATTKVHWKIRADEKPSSVG